MASSDEDEHQSNAGQKFSKDVLAVLYQFYVGGMTGWGMDHCRNIEVAIAGTGLSLSQVKGKRIYNNKILVTRCGKYAAICCNISDTKPVHRGGGEGVTITPL